MASQHQGAVPPTSNTGNNPAGTFGNSIDEQLATLLAQRVAIETQCSRSVPHAGPVAQPFGAPPGPVFLPPTVDFPQPTPHQHGSSSQQYDDELSFLASRFSLQEASSGFMPYIS
mmetsp:Transcript_57175/g.124246  ORF Transcript_57175/g.124246 Transcript_57175/m.124246 type:complete len:115 (+) Transcript_57175:29-373(+)